ncbi:hypothetical protein KI387_010105, partial [Taxus chinensis]
ENMGKGKVDMEVRADGVALITITNPPVNSLSIPVLLGLKEKYEEAMQRPDVKAIVVTGASGKFSGGFDIGTLGNAKLEGLPNGVDISVGIITQSLEGTQRLPRLVGLSKALEMILLSKPIKSEEASELGLVDAIVPPAELVNTACCWALDIAEFRRPWEASAFEELINSDTAQALIHIFFAQRSTSKVPGVTDIGVKPRKIQKVAVVGGGLMGSGIATALILSGYPVILKEVNDQFLQAGLDRIKANLQSRVKKGKMSQGKFEKTISLVQGVLGYENFRDVDMVIEDRIVGAHFFSPAHVMPLLEIVRAEKTSPQVIIDLMDVGKKIKKTPIVVGNCTGFAVNRMFFPYTQSALLLIDLGLDVYQIDRVITKFGMPMGPFRLADLVGFEVAVATGMQYLEHFPERVYKSLLLPFMMEDKRFGKKLVTCTRITPEKGIFFGMSKLPFSFTDKDIIEMVFFPVVNEACRVLDEGIAVQASDLDIASVMGMGFPTLQVTQKSQCSLIFICILLPTLWLLLA